MFESSDRNESVKTIKWMINRTNTNYIELDYDPMIYPEPVKFWQRQNGHLKKLKITTNKLTDREQFCILIILTTL